MVPVNERDENGVQIVWGWAGIAGSEDMLWTGGGDGGRLLSGLADSSGGVRGKALWGYFEAENIVCKICLYVLVFQDELVFIIFGENK